MEKQDSDSEERYIERERKGRKDDEGIGEGTEEK
jgi:hypothetical protein